MYQATIPCPKCGFQNLRGTWVCARCGSTLLIYCPACHAGNASGSQFCQSCGSPLSPSGHAPPQPQAGGYQQPYTQPQPPGQQQVYNAPDYQQPYQQYPQGYPPYGYQPPPQGGGDIISKVQGYFDSFTARLKQIASTTNPILLSALVVLVVGMTIFLTLAFQLGWIKTGGQAVTPTGPVDKQAPSISMVQVEAGAIPNSAIISWVTNEYSSSQVEYGIAPYANNTTLIENDPRTGTNKGVMVHKVGLTNLLTNSDYIYRVISIDKADNRAVSPDIPFHTLK